MHTRNRQLIFFLCGSILGFLFFTAALCFFPVPPAETRLWKGYLTILLDPQADTSLLEARFLDEGFDEVIHVNNVEIDYFDFTGLSTIKLTDIYNRFEARDPRIDPYMRDVHRYFHTHDQGQEYSIVYVREQENFLTSLVQCFRVLREIESGWRLADVKPVLSITLTGLFAVVLMFIVLTDREGWRLLIPASLPWILLIFLGGFFEFFAASLVMVTFSLFLYTYRSVFKFYLNHGYTDGGSGKAVLSLTLLLLAVLASILFLVRSSGGFMPVMRFLMSLSSTGFIFFAYLLVTVLRKNRQEHRLFFSVPLSSRKDRRWLYHLGMFGVLLFSPAIGNIEGLAPLPPVPGPVRLVQNRPISPRAVEEMHVLRKEWEPGVSGRLRLPDITDYFAHRAYQEGFLYGRQYRFPAVGERVGVSTYVSVDGERVEKEFQEKFVYTEAWFNEVLQSENPRGLPGLWLRQGTPVGSAVVTREIFSISGPSLVRHLIICLVFGLPMVFMNNRLTPQLLYGIKSLTLRRKRQAA